VEETTMSANATLTTGIVPRRRARMLTVCARCERIRLGERWVDAARAISHLRTYEWKRAPQFTHALCEPCLAALLAKRERETEPRPQASSLHSRPFRRFL
jgi:NMD protein affecting ribosome stability and mRNA decay